MIRGRAGPSEYLQVPSVSKPPGETVFVLACLSRCSGDDLSKFSRGKQAGTGACQE
jgi:hypothetical protein